MEGHITTQTLATILSVLVLIVLLGSAMGGGMMGPGMMRGYGGPTLSFHGSGSGWGWGWFSAGWLFWVYASLAVYSWAAGSASKRKGPQVRAAWIR